MLNYDDYVDIRIIKVKDEFGNFCHWESEVKFSNNSYSSGCTSPTYYGVIDEALEQIRDVAQYWTIDDSNERSI